MQVEALVQDTQTGRYWNARTGTWGTFLWNHAVVWGPSDRRAAGGSPAVTALPGRTYLVKARSTDALGNISPAVTRTITVG